MKKMNMKRPTTMLLALLVSACGGSSPAEEA